MMQTFDFSFTVHASLASAADFHRETSALRKLTPPPVFVQLHHVEPMAEGSLSEFTLWFGPCPLHWTARHSQVDPLRGFMDTQIQGPMKHWEHRHVFTAEGENTHISEHIEFEHYAGRRGLLTRLLFSSAGLYLTFCYRRWITRRSLEAKTVAK